MQSGLSGLSTDRETPGALENLGALARDRLKRYQAGSRDLDEKLIPCLDAFIEWLPSGGKESLSRDILNCQDDDAKLYEVFANLCTALLVPMKTVSRRGTVESSPFIKRQEHVDNVAASLPGPKTGDPDFRKACLQRDGYRCVITRQMETKHWEEIGEPDEENNADLEAAHIIPFSYASWKNEQGAKNASRAWETLYRCFPTVKHVAMCVENINEPYNGLMLKDFIHIQFGKFRCALASTETPNQYELKVYKRYPKADIAALPTGRITLQKAEGAEDINLPSPVLLECHYRLAEILHASGMAEVIEKRMDEWDTLKASAEGQMLMEDGSSDLSNMLRVGAWVRASA